MITVAISFLGKVAVAVAITKKNVANRTLLEIHITYTLCIYKTLAIQVPSLVPFDSSIVIVLDKKVVTGLQLFL